MTCLTERRLMVCTVWCAAIFFLAVLGLVWTNHERNTVEWQILAELTNSNGQRFRVARKCQLFEGAGWRTIFEFVDSDKKLYGSLLELESIPPWGEVRLIQTNDAVEIWRDAQLVGTLNLSKRVFRNALNGAIDEYIEGFNGVQGQRMTNYQVDYLELPRSTNGE